jgi:hypothetical protein
MAIKIIPFFKLSLFLLSLCTTIYPAVIFVHEMTHYAAYTIEGIDVLSFHILDEYSLSNGWSGYIEVERESSFGGEAQEVFAYSVEYLFLSIILYFFLFRTRLKRFLFNQAGIITGVDIHTLPLFME